MFSPNFWTKLRLSYFFSLQSFFFILVSLLMLLPSDILMFVCLSIWKFVLDINYEKIDPLSLISDMFLMKRTFVHIPKIVIVCYVILQCLIRIFFSIFVQTLLLNVFSDSYVYILLKESCFYGDITKNSVAVRLCAWTLVFGLKLK